MVGTSGLLSLILGNDVVESGAFPRIPIRRGGRFQEEHHTTEKTTLRVAFFALNDMKNSVSAENITC